MEDVVKISKIINDETIQKKYVNVQHELEKYHKKRILITGHTGFKGAWMCSVLKKFGAHVAGYSLQVPPTEPNLYHILNHVNYTTNYFGDIRNLEKLKETFRTFQPEIVIHMAAQPIVRESYRNPVYTYDVNVMGTVNILECVRTTKSVKSFVNITTDKVYLNKEWIWGYRENEELNGYDPYSNSKSCSELITESYNKSFFSKGVGNDKRDVAISTIRAGNVIGGGDFAQERIIPDCIRAVENKTAIKVRYPYSVRPYQHVIEPIIAYLMIAIKQLKNTHYAGNYNVGPDECSCITTGELVDCFCNEWKISFNQKVNWTCMTNDHGPHEANYLKLDCSKIKNTYGWKPIWNANKSIRHIVEWEKAYLYGEDMEAFTSTQIEQYLSDMKDDYTY